MNLCNPRCHCTRSRVVFFNCRHSGCLFILCMLNLNVYCHNNWDPTFHRKPKFMARRNLLCYLFSFREQVGFLCYLNWGTVLLCQLKFWMECSYYTITTVILSKSTNMEASRLFLLSAITSSWFTCCNSG